MLVSYLSLGIVMGFLGTIVESTVVSFQKGKFVYRGASYLWNIPIKPIYAVGGVLMYISIRMLGGVEWYLVIPLTVLILTVWEYVGGWFCVKVLHKRLWDYRKRKLNLDGHISLWSVGWWFVMVIIFYFYLYDWVDLFMKIIDRI